MLIRLDFLKLETDHFVFSLGARADFFHQLKLDFFRDLSESIYFFNHKKSFLHLRIATICLNIGKIHTFFEMHLLLSLQYGMNNYSFNVCVIPSISL